jgi:hypothetical protein
VNSVVAPRELAPLAEVVERAQDVELGLSNGARADAVEELGAHHRIFEDAVHRALVRVCPEHLAVRGNQNQFHDEVPAGAILETVPVETVIHDKKLEDCGKWEA